MSYSKNKKNCMFLITFLFETKIHFEKRVPTPKSMHALPQLKNTLSPPGLVLMILSTLLHSADGF